MNSIHAYLPEEATDKKKMTASLLESFDVLLKCDQMARIRCCDVGVCSDILQMARIL